MKCRGSSVVAIAGSLLVLSTAFAQVKTPRPTGSPAKENLKAATRFTSDTDKFEVVLPAAPTIKKESRLISGQQLSLTYYGASRGESDYAVLVLVGFNEPNWQVAHMLMLDFYSRVNELSNASSFKAVFQKDISLDGYVGRQFGLEAVDKVGEWRIYQVNKMFYAVAGSSNSSHAASLAGFFDSFALSRDTSTVASANSAAGRQVTI